MLIQTGLHNTSLVRPPAGASTGNASTGNGANPTAVLLTTPLEKRPDWREFTVNEIMVEIPQAALDITDFSDRYPVPGGVAQSVVSGLAFVRGYQGLSGATLEQKLEGASSLALGVAGVLSLAPGGLAAHASQAFMLGQAALEVGLGVRELNEELRKDRTPDWKEIATGSLDVLKGASSFLPLFFPAAADVVTGVQVGALLSKAALEATIERSTEE